MIYNIRNNEWHQAIIWTSADILSIRPEGTYFNEILFEIQIFSFKKTRLNMSSSKWQPFCPGEMIWNYIRWILTRAYNNQLFIFKEVQAGDRVEGVNGLDQLSWKKCEWLTTDGCRYNVV